MYRLLTISWLIYWLALPPAAHASGPHLSVEPDGGNAGAMVRVAGSGWPPGLHVALGIGRPSAGLIRDLASFVVAADGSLSGTVALGDSAAGTRLTAGPWVLLAYSQDMPARATTTFTVLAANGQRPAFLAPAVGAEAIVSDSQVAGRLAASGGGSFAYQVIDYPGQNLPLTLEAWFDAHDPVIASAVGLNLYDIGGGTLEAQRCGGAAARFCLTYRSPAATSLLVQLFSYNTRSAVAFAVGAKLG